jgi:diguanylate cyclase (GGDEF)-like protein
VTSSILVVDDEALVAFDIQTALASLGYHVPATAASAVEALEAVEAHRPNLVLMDVRLQGKSDGIATAEIVRRDYGIPVVFLTSYSDRATVARAKTVSPYGYLLKPFTEHELGAAIEVALQRHEVEARLAEKTALLEAVVSSMGDAVIAVDSSGRTLVFNAAAKRIVALHPLSHAPSEPQSEFGLYLPDGVTRCPPEEMPMRRAMRGEMLRNIELFIRTPEHPDGRWHSVNATPLKGPDGVVRGGVTVGRDVTELKAMQIELRQLSDTDPLTGVYNRRGFLTLSKRELDKAALTGTTPAVFFVDLNGMKQINDTLGHQEGDRLISDATAVLRKCFRGSDVVGRLGGDEFAILTPDVGVQNIDLVRTRLDDAVSDFNENEARPYRLSMSVGVAVYDRASPATIESLVETADQLMYEDKDRRRRERSGVTRNALHGRNAPREASASPTDRTRRRGPPSR